MAAIPPAAAAFDVPTAGVPTYLFAGALGAASLLGCGFCLTGSFSGPAMSTSCAIDSALPGLVSGHQWRRHLLRVRPHAISRLARGFEHKVSESFNELGGVVQAGHHFKLTDAQPGGFLTRFMIDFAKRFHMVGNERDGHDADVAHAFGRELAQSAMERGLQPLAGSNFALVAEAMVVQPACASHQERNRFFDLTLIGITLIDDGLRQAVRAENNLGTTRTGMSASNRRFHSFRLLPTVVLE